METDQLKSFIVVAQTLSFSEAARRNYVSQPAISHHIETLERQFGAKFFERSTHGVSLTREGMEFLPCAIDILNTIQSAELRLQKSKAGYHESVTIFAIPTAREWLMRCLEAFSRKYPNIFMNIRFVNGVDQAHSINDENCDFSFACLSVLPGTEKNDYIHAQRVGFSLLLPANHRLVGSESIDFKYLSKDPFISILHSEGPMLSEQIITICKNRHMIPRITTYCNEASAVLISVSAGAGISVLPTPLISDYKSDSIVAVDIEGDDAYFDLYIVWKKNNANPAALKFLNLLNELFPDKAQANHSTDRLFG